MSSLAATQADGYYVSPDYFESGAYKKVGKNQWRAISQQHKNGGSKKRQHQPANVFRFELPYDGFCCGCGQHVKRGTRFNAAKSNSGERYHTTEILEFRMKCRNAGGCDQLFVIRTNPKDRGFDYADGIRKQHKTPDDYNHDNHSQDCDYDEHDEDPLKRLESMALGKRQAMTERDHLQAMAALNNKTYGQDADVNALVRNHFRGDRRDKKQRLQAASKLGWRPGMELLPSDTNNTSDVVQSKTVVYGNRRQHERNTFQTLRKGSIFQKTTTITAGVASSKTRRTTRQHELATPLRPHGAVSSSALPRIAPYTTELLQPSFNNDANYKNKKRKLVLAVVGGRARPTAATVTTSGTTASSSVSPPTTCKPKSALDSLADYYDSD